MLILPKSGKSTAAESLYNAHMPMFQGSARVLGGVLLLSLALSAQTFTTLYNFGSSAYDGFNPYAGVIVGPLGELYGTASGGGERKLGMVYELLPPISPGETWTEVVLHSFNGTDGVTPQAGLLLGPRGALYGVTEYTAFELDPPTAGSTHWPLNVLNQFTGSSGSPSGSLIFGPGGSLYGLTNTSVYSLTPPVPEGALTTAWTHQTLFTFPGHFNPLGTLAVGGNGTLFGVTYAGGRLHTNPACIAGCGTVFSLMPPAVSGGSWTVRILYGSAHLVGPFRPGWSSRPPA